jgi:hypothetical protein
MLSGMGNQPLSTWLRARVVAATNRAALSRDTQVPQAVLSRFASGESIALKHVDKLAEHFGLSLPARSAGKKGRIE